MKRKPFFRIPCMIIIAIFLICFSAYAAENMKIQPDIILKVSRLQQLLTIIDNMAVSDQTVTGQSPTMFIKAMLQGTEWIDPDRSIIVGINFNELGRDDKPAIAALIPFIEENESFKNTYNAVSGNNYYIVPLPPGQGGIISDHMKVGLVSTSLVPGDGFFSLEISAAKLVQKADKQIQKFLMDLEKKNPGNKKAPVELTSADVKKLIQNLLHIARQIETISLGMDITKSDLVIFSDLNAMAKSDLAKLFVRNQDSRFSFMKTYKPDYQINFKSNSYDLDGMIKFFNANFGDIYKKLGLDFSSIDKIASYFTGEMAGGMSFQDNGLDYEMIVVLTDSAKSEPAFIKTQYLPWVMDYGQKITQLYNRQNPGGAVKNLFLKTAESTIAGHNVYGIKGEIPLYTATDIGLEKIEFNLRMMTIDNFMLTASTDKQLENLIQIAQTLQRKADSDPLMKADIDMGEYFESVKKMLPQAASGSDLNFPKLGRISYTMDMTDGQLVGQYKIQLDDIKSMISFFQKASTAGSGPGRGNIYEPESSSSRYQKESHTQYKKPPLDETSAQYWINKGMLYSTYGSDSAAIKYFNKAIAIDPNISSAYFNLGLSYAGQGDYKKAIDALNQAINLNPDNGDYLYGRGWVYQLDGDQSSALKDFQKAAELGSSDAQRYIQRTSR